MLQSIHGVSEWIKKKSIYIYKRLILDLKIPADRTIYHANGCQKKVGIAIHISDKLDFKTKTVKRDEEGHYIIIKGSIHQDPTVVWDA